MKATRTCSVADCDSPHAARGMCDTHYRNLRRHGTPIAPSRPRRGRCSVDDCTKPHEAFGYCHAHYMQLRRHGDPLARTPRGADNSPSWTGDAVGYSGAHRRLSRRLGPAAGHPCIDCGETAAHWAYDHGDSAARPSPVGAFSTNPAHYMPMCAPCHKAFDTRHRHLSLPTAS